MAVFRSLLPAFLLGLIVPSACAQSGERAPQEPESGWEQGLDGLREARLAPPARDLLGRNGFVIRTTTHAGISEIYDDAKKLGQCQFVTTDAMLHTGHVFFDYLLRLLEIDRLAGMAETLTDTMLGHAAAQYRQIRNPDLREAARLNIGFFAVAKAQFVPGYLLGNGLDELVRQELAHIAAHKGLAPRPLLPYVKHPSLDDTPWAFEDYSQYVPRGHYTRNETFQKYFRAMMWYGRIDYKLKTPGDDDAARRMTAQALLIAEALSRDPEALRLWRQIYEPTVYFVGKTDDLTVDDYTALARAVFPGEAIERLADRKRQAEFIDRAGKLRAPRISSGPGSEIGFRFMGQRFIPDSHILQELVHGAKGDGTPPEPDLGGSGGAFTMVLIPGKGPARGFPRGLDVMAVLGSGRALEILRAEGDINYRDYERQRAMLAKLYRATTPQEWRQNLYWRWLHALLPLLEERRTALAAVQPFLASPAWRDKELQTALGSWTELRHDTILYAKQSYTAFGKSIQIDPPPAAGYVEPAPEVYARLAAMFGDLHESLGALGVAADGVPAKLKEFEAVLRRLQTISTRELAGQPLGREDHAWLDRFGATLASLTRFPPELMKRITSDTDARMDVIADVHTDVNTRGVLEEGVGSPADIFVRVRDDQGYRLCRGGVFTYYEFKWPMADRLTDEKWQQMGRDGKRPPRPAWARTLGD